MSYQRYAPVDAQYLEGTGLQSAARLDWQRYAKQGNFHRYDTVYIVLGTNDFITPQEITACQQKAQRLIQTIKQQNAHVVWLLPPTLQNAQKNAQLTHTRQAIQQAADMEHIVTIDMRQSLGAQYTDSINRVTIRTPDGIHIPPKGSDKLVQLLIPSQSS